MKSIKTGLSVLLVAGSLGASGVAIAADEIVMDEGGYGMEQATQVSNYCHMKFPAIEEGTLAGDHPVLKDPNTGDIVDFYGPCGENPLGKEQIASQKLDNQHRWETEFASD